MSKRDLRDPRVGPRVGPEVASGPIPRIAIWLFKNIVLFQPKWTSGAYRRDETPAMFKKLIKYNE